MTADAPEPLSFSVIVASRHRPAWLKRCLTALRQLDHPLFEIVVVADEETLAGLDDPHVRFVRCDEANLAMARNLGVRRSGGEICAFIDDDAVAEPMWLRHLEAAFELPDVSAVVGYVRGRNGISFQSRILSIDAEGETHEEEALSRELPSVPELRSGCALKLVGTNFAIRRSALSRLGGFDESYRFFLEDSDLSFRLMQSGGRAAAAPLAQVHHGFAPSERRSGRRTPLDLFDIGRSTAIYLRRHFGSPEQAFWERLMQREEMRLARHLVAGFCEPRDVTRRLERLQAGWQDGATCELTAPRIASGVADFARFPARPSEHTVLSSRWLSKRRKLVRDAGEIVTSGRRASVFSFSLTPVRHHVRYVDPGVWLQTGGVYGPSDRDGPLVRWCRFADRVRMEVGRVAKQRGIGQTTFGKWWDQSRGDAQGM